jgi:hypothetical protein
VLEQHVSGSSQVPDVLPSTYNNETGNTIDGHTTLGFTDASGSTPGVGQGAPLLLPGTVTKA